MCTIAATDLNLAMALWYCCLGNKRSINLWSYIHLLMKL